MPERLSPLDAAFLHVETPTAHMHVGFRARFAPAPDRPPITLERVRRLVASRLGLNRRFRQRLVFTPGGFGPPAWTDDEAFDLSRHVVALGDEESPMPRRRFDALVDAVLSAPLDRSRPLWELHLAPWIDDGTAGVVMKAHHAMVDGLSAVSLAMLLLDPEPDGPEPPGQAADGWTPRARPGAARMMAGAPLEPLRAAGRLARQGTGLGGTLRRAALAFEEDVLRGAPSSPLNVPIGPRRMLVGHTADIGRALAIRERRGVTLNDVALAAVAGALRQLTLSRGVLPGALKAMVPVARRAPDEAAALGNRIAFVSVPLPVNLRRPQDRLTAIHAATRRFKASGRAAGGEALVDALGALPGPLQPRAARLAASPRAYNLVVSNVPGPRRPVYLLGARALEAFPVIPLSDHHALSVGVVSVDDRLCFGCYADPEALPDVTELPGALAAALLELDGGTRRARRAAT